MGKGRRAQRGHNHAQRSDDKDQVDLCRLGLLGLDKSS